MEKPLAASDRGREEEEEEKEEETEEGAEGGEEEIEGEELRRFSHIYRLSKSNRLINATCEGLTSTVDQS